MSIQEDERDRADLIRDDSDVVALAAAIDRAVWNRAIAAALEAVENAPALPRDTSSSEATAIRLHTIDICRTAVLALRK